MFLTIKGGISSKYSGEIFSPKEQDMMEDGDWYFDQIKTLISKCKENTLISEEQTDGSRQEIGSILQITWGCIEGLIPIEHK